MPTRAEGLSPRTSDDEYRAAVEDCIKQLIDEGRDPAQAQAICYRQAESAAGRPYPRQAAATPEATAPLAPTTLPTPRRRRRGRRYTTEGTLEF